MPRRSVVAARPPPRSAASPLQVSGTLIITCACMTVPHIRAQTQACGIHHSHVQLDSSSLAERMVRVAPLVIMCTTVH